MQRCFLHPKRCAAALGSDRRRATLSAYKEARRQNGGSPSRCGKELWGIAPQLRRRVAGWGATERERPGRNKAPTNPPAEPRLFVDIRKGFVNLFGAVLVHVGPIAGIFLLVFRRARFDRKTVAKNDYARLVLRKYGLILAGLILVILAARVTGFKDRWFAPVFISLPLLLFAVVRDQLNPAHSKAIATLGCVVAFLVLSIIPGRIIWAEKIGRTQLLNAPYRKMAGDLAASISPDALVIAESKWVGGNLRLLFPDLNVVTPELVQLYPAANRKLAMVWDGSRRESPSRTANLFIENMGLHLQEPSVFVQANYQFYREKVFRLGVSGLKRTEDER